MNEIKQYENKPIRSIWDNEKEEWYFSVVDVVGVLTEQETQRGASTYWAVLKKRLKEEGSEVLTVCKHLKLKAPDGKMRATDVADMPSAQGRSQRSRDLFSSANALVSPRSTKPTSFSPA